MTQKRTLLAILLTCFGYACFNVGDAMIKLLAEFHFSQIVLFNSGIIAVVMTAYGFYRGRQSFHMLQPKLILLRAVLAMGCSVINAIALPHLTLTTFYTLIFTCPLWVALFSAFFLKEKLEPRRVAAIIAGFAIVLYIFQPGSGLWNAWSGMVLVSAFCFSAAMTVMRRMGEKESRVSIIVVGGLVSVLSVSPWIPSHFVVPDLPQWGAFTAMGLTGAIGMLALAYAFQIAPSAATVAPYHYTQIIWGALLGYFMFGDVPEHRTMVGALLLIAAGLYLLYGEARAARRQEEIAKAELAAR